jgi:hypothetical protein
MTYTKIISFLLAPLLIASSAMSQTDDWGAVQALRNGTKIKVTLKHGPTFGHCFFDGASDDQLFCISGRWPLSRRKTYLRDDIKAVYLTHNGPAIGLGVGAGAGAIIGASGDPVPGLGRGGTALLDAGLLGGLGAFFGMVLDPFFHGRVVYRSPQDPYKGHTDPSSLPNGQNTSQPPVNVPSCLRDGVTFQCVDQ